MNPFEVLGVPTDADDSTLKRAYAAKVRAHPPETDPIGFQRITEAFEILRDPVQREAITERLKDPELAALFEGAQQAVLRGSAAAGDVVQALINRFPDYRPARELQIRYLLRLGRVDEAKAFCEAYAARFARDLEALLFIASIDLELDEGVKAFARVEAACAIAPADRRAQLLRASVLERMERWPAALEAVELALSSTDRRYVTDAQVIARRVLLRLALDQRSIAEAEVTKLVTDATSSEARVSTATLLVQLAGHILEKGRTQHVSFAARLFEQATQLDSRRTFTLDVHYELPISELPPELSAHVAKIRETRPPHVLQLPQSTTLAGCALLIGVALASAGLLFLADRFLEPELKRWAVNLVGLGAVALVLYMLFRPTRPRDFDFLELRPMHLIRAQRNRVTVVPILRIAGVMAVGTTAASVQFEDGGAMILDSIQSKLADFFGALEAQLHRLRCLASCDLLENELEREPLPWRRHG